MRRPFFWNKSTMPSASGLSGPTTVSSTFFSCANASSFGKSSAPRFTHSTGAEFLASRSCAMPALPGAHHSCVTCGDCASFHTSACSRPPEPMTRSFMKYFSADYAACRGEAMRRRDGADLGSTDDCFGFNQPHVAFGLRRLQRRFRAGGMFWNISLQKTECGRPRPQLCPPTTSFP